MKQRTKRSRRAQNRIAYIVYGHPDGVRNLIEKYDFEVPDNIQHLLSATKQLVRRKGRRFVKELIKLHPDRKAILQVEKIREDSYCSACSNYSFDAESNYCGTCGHSAYTGSNDRPVFLKQLVGLSVKELEELYENVVHKSNKNPQNQPLAEEVRLVWNELRLRKKESIPSTDQVSKPNTTESSKEGIVVQPTEALLILGLTLVAGGLIGSAWKFNKSVV
ncbi:MAG: hypothetical protein R8G66_06150 [Cytophagales bacterium]|nr:hypothetical protein [Cytophagales bacterium]